MSTILVTDGSGFIASHCILPLLAAGHRVRTTVRSLRREGEVRDLLKRGGVEPGDRLSFIAAGLEEDAGWPQAVEACDFALHVASPLPARTPRHEDELIVPARDGTIRVLRAARDAGVRRVVLTSSFAAIGYGHRPQQAPFDETSWTDFRGEMSAYAKSKTLAERAAWDFMAREGGALELSVVNPVAVLGPGAGARLFDLDRARAAPDGRHHAGLSSDAIWRRRRARRGRPAYPRDDSSGRQGRMLAGRCGGLHVGARYRQDAEAPPGRAGEASADMATAQLACALCRAARRLLGWTLRPSEEALVATAESLLRLGLLKR